MARLLHLQVLTPAASLLDAEDVERVHLRLADGTGLSIYPGHAPLLAETVTAPLRYVDESGEHLFDVEAGILQVEENNVMIFTSGRPEDVDTGAPSAVSTERRFERLAQELHARLQDEQEDLLETDDGRQE